MQSLNPQGPHVDHAIDILYRAFHQQERLIRDGQFVLSKTSGGAGEGQADS
jgi:hypothetical protein